MSSITNNKPDLSVTNLIIPRTAGYNNFSRLLLYVYSCLDFGILNAFPIHMKVNHCMTFALRFVLEMQYLIRLEVR